MRGQRFQSRRMALAGVFGALALTMMLLGGVLPFATFAAPGIAGLFIVPVAIEFGMKTGYLLYAAVGLLSFFLVPDREMSLIFLFLLGFYPLLKAAIERIRSHAARWAVKLAVFNLSIGVMYALLLFVFPLDAVVEELSGGWLYLALLWGLGNVTFVLYDIAVARIVALYCARLRPRLTKMH